MNLKSLAIKSLSIFMIIVAWFCILIAVLASQKASNTHQYGNAAVFLFSGLWIGFGALAMWRI